MRNSYDNCTVALGCALCMTTFRSSRDSQARSVNWSITPSKLSGRQKLVKYYILVVLSNSLMILASGHQYEGITDCVHFECYYEIEVVSESYHWALRGIDGTWKIIMHSLRHFWLASAASLDHQATTAEVLEFCKKSQGRRHAH